MRKNVASFLIALALFWGKIVFPFPFLFPTIPRNNNLLFPFLNSGNEFINPFRDPFLNFGNVFSFKSYSLTFEIELFLPVSVPELIKVIPAHL